MFVTLNQNNSSQHQDTIPSSSSRALNCYPHLARVKSDVVFSDDCFCQSQLCSWD